mmetsp:Transcript_23481/g.40501  ORF Transcript_23481/g.40501 Transcript_23481/m.40501 type:complete len:404 (-) Transcript_23481:1816-3027(-)
MPIDLGLWIMQDFVCAGALRSHTSRSCTRTRTDRCGAVGQSTCTKYSMALAGTCAIKGTVVVSSSSTSTSILANLKPATLTFIWGMTWGGIGKGMGEEVPLGQVMFAVWFVPLVWVVPLVWFVMLEVMLQGGIGLELGMGGMGPSTSCTSDVMFTVYFPELLRVLTSSTGTGMTYLSACRTIGMRSVVLFTLESTSAPYARTPGVALLAVMLTSRSIAPPAEMLSCIGNTVTAYPGGAVTLTFQRLRVARVDVTRRRMWRVTLVATIAATIAVLSVAGSRGTRYVPAASSTRLDPVACATSRMPLPVCSGSGEGREASIMADCSIAGVQLGCCCLSRRAAPATTADAIEEPECTAPAEVPATDAAKMVTPGAASEGMEVNIPTGRPEGTWSATEAVPTYFPVM